MRNHPQFADALALRARLLFGRGENSAAINHCLQALRLDPDQAEAKAQLKLVKAMEAKKVQGNEAFKQGRFEESCQLYQEALKLASDSLENSCTLLSNLAIACYKVFL